MKPIRFLLGLALMAPLAALAQAQTAAESFAPTRPVTLVVPFTPSSGSDIIARIVGPKLSARWGQPVIVENKPGASSSIGTNTVAKAAPDGHTLLMAVDTFTMAPAVLKSVPYDPLKDFTPVAKLADASYAFAVNPDVPAKDMKALLDYIKANPGKLNYASPGSGTPHHLTMELLKARLGLDILHVPYKGISGALTELMGGQVQVMYGTVSSMKPFAESGKLRLLGVTGAARNPLAPDVPTFREQGMENLDSGSAYYFVLAPAATPPDVLARLNRDFTAVMNTDQVKAELAAQGMIVNTDETPAQLSSRIASDLARWRKVAADSRITAD